VRAIAKFALRGPTSAAISAAVYAVFALFFPLFMTISGAVIGLSTLRLGAGVACRVLGVAMVFAGLVYFLLLREASAVLILAAGWIPVLLVGQVLRVTKNQGLSMALCASFAMLYATFVRVTVPDVGTYWLAWIQSLSDAIREQGGKIFEPEEIIMVAEIMHEATIVVVCLYWMSAVLLARWWQAGLFNPGGFGAEFRLLVIPRLVSPFAAIVAILVLLSLVTGSEKGLASDLLIVLVVLFAFQGLSLLHHRVHQIEMATGWLVGFYLLLMLMPHLIGLILGFIGITDTVVDFRRLRNRKSSTQ